MDENKQRSRIGVGELWAIGVALSYAMMSVVLKWALSEASQLLAQL